MLIIGNRTLHDSIYGMVYRVTVGALLSITDAVTDIYAILTYYKTPELISQANILLTMILTNTFIQLLFVLLQYKRKSNKTKLNEILITLFFLRPAVDAVCSERAVRTPVGATTRHICTARFRNTDAYYRVATQCYRSYR